MTHQNVIAAKNIIITISIFEKNRNSNMKWHRMRAKVRKQKQHFPLLDFVYIASYIIWNAV
jgi:hypothetical protein